MTRIRYSITLALAALAGGVLGCSGLIGDQALSVEELACRAITDIRNLTVASAQLVEATESTPAYCYVQGMISPAIRYHVQLPLPENWNGRFLNWGDGGKDGALNLADHRVAEGYAVANSNSGHDSGSEPGPSFAFNNRQAEIDFGYRAVHLTVKAAQTTIEAYYGREAEYSYHEGCSTGGRQGLMEGQRYPYDFDGIVAGAPVNFYQALHANRSWLMQKIFKNNFAGNLAFDTNGDGSYDSLTKVTLLKESVLAKCDANDGIADGVIDDPLSCDFDPKVDLADLMCAGDVNADDCFTTVQVQTLEDIYAGAHDSKGVSIYPGVPLGSEFSWPDQIIPHAGNSMFPPRLRAAYDHINYLFYETDPGVPTQNPADLSLIPDKNTNPPEWIWWEFNVDDFTAGRADLMRSITDATDPELTRFLVKNGGKLILYHGWADLGTHPQTTVDYYKDVVDTTFGGDKNATRDHIRLFMEPGMTHCRGGTGPNEWDKLAPLVKWVEDGIAPESIVAVHKTDGVVDNERPICPYPELAVYTGPAGGENDPANWVESNFTCQ